MEKQQNFIIAGIQGSGKGTQARLLEKEFGWVHIGTGALCRWHLEHKTLFGKELKAINRGKFASDELMIRLVERRLEIHDFDYPFLLDGFPRNKSQADYLFSRYPFAAVIYLELPQDMAMQRAQGRIDGKQVRKDDNEEALKRRFKLFYEHTEPMKEMFDKLGILHTVNGSENIDTVHQNIISSLKKRKAI